VLVEGLDEPLLAVLLRSEQGLRREILEKTLAGLEGQSVLAVVDRTNRAIYSPRPLDDTEYVLSVAFGEAAPFLAPRPLRTRGAVPPRHRAPSRRGCSPPPSACSSA
jgi:hypothetical protein